MAASSAGYHEPIDLLKPATLDRHRAIVSLMEEFEAIDWYDQRIDATGNPALAAILVHNRDEEKEHAAMLLEWLRRHDAKLDENLREYLFIAEPVVQKEHEVEAAAAHDATPAPEAGSLGIGSLRRETQR
jgi:ferritin-like protein